MKKIYSKFLTALLVCFSVTAFSQSDLIITGILDGTLSGGLPKGLEIYVVNDVADLSVYGISNANNGNPSPEVPLFTFPADIAIAGSYLYIGSEVDGFTSYFGFAPDYNVGSVIGVNGDDVVELYHNGVVVDYYGEIGVDGSGSVWEYTDGWAYRVNGTGPNTTFTTAEWIFSGVDANENQTTNETAANPWPIGTYTMDAGGGDVTIVEIQETVQGNGASPLLGQSVTTTGIVTAAYANGFWIQDGAGMWTGVYVNQADPTVVQGDEVTLTGLVEENFGLTRLNNVADLMVNSSGNTLPTPISVSTADAGTEAYESVLIQVSSATCLDANLGFGEWLIDDGSGDYRVDDVLYDAAPVQFNEYDLVGIAYYSFNNFKMLPRDADDVTIVAENQLAIGFESQELSFDETAGTVSVNVTITNPFATPTTVEVVVTGGTAENGTHYNFTSPTTLTFPADATDSQSFEIEIIDDLDGNEDRTITFELQNASNDPIIAIGELTVIIEDNDTEIVITPIGTVNETDAQGVAVNNGVEYTIAGIVHGVNMNAAGLSFTVIDETGGIGIYSGVPVDGYTVTEGDSIHLTGTVNQFNGLTQMGPSSIALITQGNEVNEPTVVTELSEATESQVIKIECVFIPNPSQWSNSGSGFTVQVSNGTNTFDIRIDNDVDLYSAPVPVGTFDVVGIGGQFDNSSPFDGGYQLLPRYVADITSSECELEQPPANDMCTSALDVGDLMGGDVGETLNSVTYTNVAATVTGTSPTSGFDCFGEPDGTGSAPSVEADVWFSFTGDGNTYFIETNNCDGNLTDYIPDGDTQIALYSGICAIATPVACNEDGPNAEVGNYAAGLEISTVPGQSYFMRVDGYNGAEGEFCISFTRLPVGNDNCGDATDLTSLTGGAIDLPQTSSPFTNIGATSVNDPNPNADENCWFGEPLVQQSVWFSFTGDGGSYFIETMNCQVEDYNDDTQMAAFTGDCADLTQIACNEDVSSTNFAAGLSLQTTAGTEYYIMVDGYEDVTGNFCMQFTAEEPSNVNNANAFEFEVYPNPSADRFFVNAPQAVEAATLTNVLGQEVRAFQFTASERLELEVSGLDAGIYILQLRSGNEFSTAKVVVE